MGGGSERPGPDRGGGQAQPDGRRPCPALAGRSASRLCHSGGHHHIRPRRRPPAARDLASAKWGSRAAGAGRSEEQTSGLQSLMRISYAVFCMKKKITTNKQQLLTEDVIQRRIHIMLIKILCVSLYLIRNDAYT